MKGCFLKITTALVLIFACNSSLCQNLTKEELRQMTAFMINMKGYLCAEIIELRPLRLENTYEVDCIEYRGGKGVKTYIFSMKDKEYIVYPQ